MSEQAELSCDVLVVGGGPAGSTAAALLAEAGRDVIVVEKDAHPRFHIGESLLPRNQAVIKRLGLFEEVAALGVHKPGAEFVSDDTGRSAPYSFGNALNKSHTFAWQVRRADFDALLFANARRKGARTMERTRVKDVQFAERGGRAEVAATGPDGEALRIRPRFVLDATGRDALLAGRMQVKDANKRTNTAATYAHFHGVEQRTGELEGYITVHLTRDGWFWVIRLPDGVTSVGFVGNQAAYKGRQGTPQAMFLDRIAQSPTLRPRMARAELASEIVSTGNYSYRARAGHGDGYMMIGDAYGFVDPMFSTGVLFAMTGGELGAKAVDTWLDDPAKGRALCAKAGRDLARAMDRITWMISRINDPVLRTLFFAPRNTLWMRDGIVNMLAGNLTWDPRAVIPVLSFKTVYHITRLLDRTGFGPRLPEKQPAATAALAPAE